MTPRGMTPMRGGPGATPGQTPLRDKLNINQGDGFDPGSFDKYEDVSRKFKHLLHISHFNPLPDDKF